MSQHTIRYSLVAAERMGYKYARSQSSTKLLNADRVEYIWLLLVEFAELASLGLEIIFAHVRISIDLSIPDGGMPGNQAENGVRKSQPVASGETNLLDPSIISKGWGGTPLDISRTKYCPRIFWASFL